MVAFFYFRMLVSLHHLDRNWRNLLYWAWQNSRAPFHFRNLEFKRRLLRNHLVLSEPRWVLWMPPAVAVTLMYCERHLRE